MKRPLSDSLVDRAILATRSTLWDVVPRDHRQSEREFRRRQVVTALTLVIGAIALAVSLNIEPGNRWFYLATLALPAIWLGGGFAAGPLHLGSGPRGRTPARTVAAPAVVALVLVAVFVIGALVTREVPVFESAVTDLLEYARQGNLAILVIITVINGVAEEIFFRGALYASIPGRHQVAWTTALYCVTVAATGNLPLAFAAAVLGVVVGLERRASGGVLAPIITHVVWSTAMLLILPRVFA